MVVGSLGCSVFSWFSEEVSVLHFKVKQIRNSQDKGRGVPAKRGRVDQYSLRSEFPEMVIPCKSPFHQPLNGYLDTCIDRALIVFEVVDRLFVFSGFVCSVSHFCLLCKPYQFCVLFTLLMAFENYGN